MRERPNLPFQEIGAHLGRRYDIAVTELEFLPLGNDAKASVLRVHTGDGATYFLKVKRGPVPDAVLLVPRWFRDSGIEQVIAPLPAQDGALFLRLKDYTLILYPFIDGEIGLKAGLNEEQWFELGVILRKIHRTRVPPGIRQRVPRETFQSKWLDVVQAVEREIDEKTYQSRFTRDLAAFWHERRLEIHKILARTERLGRYLQAEAGEYVLCHADIHTANILLDREGGLGIVDWDETILAPKERDLMFIVSGNGSKSDLPAGDKAFFAGYGEANVDRVTHSYYRHEWVVQELGDYGERVLFSEEHGDETKAEAIRELHQLFEPGDVVEEAMRSYVRLPGDLPSDPSE